MLAQGELCRGCGRECIDKPTDLGSLEIQDVSDPSKTWSLTQCPRQFTAEIVDAVNLAQIAERHLPIAGGILDQSAWWVDCYMALKSDMNQIETDRLERERRRNG